jgi:hypothetical protein
MSVYLSYKVKIAEKKGINLHSGHFDYQASSRSSSSSGGSSARNNCSRISLIINMSCKRTRLLPVILK